MPYPAIDMHRDLPAHGVDDLGQGVQRCQGTVKLASAVIGDDNAVNAVVDGEEGVFGGGDAFDPDLHFRRALGFEPVNVAVPAQG